ncbi:MAG TPA: hypothetical protein VLY24_03410 [Bryobacteraceae bacterium]|nr:hypothetical protein [Bryobacteraceae bacterium]
MNEPGFLLTAGIVFLLIALGHFLRIIFGTPVVVYNIPIPVWASWIAVVIMGFLSYEGFHLARKGPRQ